MGSLTAFWSYLPSFSESRGFSAPLGRTQEPNFDRLPLASHAVCFQRLSDTAFESIFQALSNGVTQSSWRSTVFEISAFEKRGGARPRLIQPRDRNTKRQQASFSYILLRAMCAPSLPLANSYTHAPGFCQARNCHHADWPFCKLGWISFLEHPGRPAVSRRVPVLWPIFMNRTIVG